MKINIGKKGIMYITGGAALAAIVVLSCGKVGDSVVRAPVVETIEEEETQETSATDRVVTASGFGVSVAEGLTQTIADGSPAVFTLTLTVGFTLTSSVGGTCPSGTFSDSVYTIPAITADCSVEFKADSTSGIQLLLSSDHTTSITVTPNRTGEKRLITPVVPTVPMTAATSNLTPSYSFSTAVGGTCPPGTWNAGNTQYTTGATTGTCTVIFTLANPCSNVIASSSARWQDVGAIMTTQMYSTDGTTVITSTSQRANSGCTSAGCHGRPYNTTKYSTGYVGPATITSSSGNGITIGTPHVVLSYSELGDSAKASMYTFVKGGYGVTGCEGRSSGSSAACGSTNSVVSNSLYSISAGTAASYNSTPESGCYNDTTHAATGAPCIYPASGTTQGSSKIVQSYDPLNSALYRKVTASYTGGGTGRMPGGSSSSTIAARKLTQIEQDTMCNWVWHGAQNN